jgi:NADH:quinone reductase (non-electrogenic)
MDALSKHSSETDGHAGRSAGADGLAPRLTSDRAPQARRRPHVVVVGAGFAGLHVIRGLRRAPVDVTLIDRHNYHLFQPLLYQVATAALEPADISGPLRQLVRGDNVSILMGQVESVDVARRCVHLLDRELEYDYLVLATGAAHSYFGHDEWEPRAPGLKTVEDALEIRRRVLYAFEAAERETDPEQQRAWLTFVVIGGGPTGVELAGALAEISRSTRPREFRHIDPSTARVILLEGLPRVLTAYSEDLSEKARKSLERLGVEVHTNTLVTAIDAHEVKSKDLNIVSRTVLWAAGVAASPIARTLGAELDKPGRVKVTPQLTVPGHDEIFVIGDLVHLEQDGQILPGLAPVAIAQGKHTATNLVRAVHGQSLQPFRYHDKGSFAVIGRGAGVGVAFGWAMSGVLAWLMWLAIHITFLIGFRNRIAVLFNWAYVYFTKRRHAQLIVGEAPLTEGAPSVPHPRERPYELPASSPSSKRAVPASNPAASNPVPNGASLRPGLPGR